MNHRKYIRARLKWYIGDGRKICFWTNYWVYMVPLISFVKDSLQYIYLDV